MIDYYRQRAHEYERIYHRPGRQADIVRLRDHLRRALTGRRILEVACGTGYWTAEVAECAESIVATDVVEEVLEIARAKALNPARVSFVRADAWHPVTPSRDFNAGLAAFWWSHIPRAKLAAFLNSFHAALQPGARVVFADNRFVEGSSTPVSRIDADGDTWQIRSLENGSTHEVLKNFPSSGELHDVLAPFGDNIEIAAFDYFWCVTYDLKAPPPPSPPGGPSSEE